MLYMSLGRGFGGGIRRNRLKGREKKTITGKGNRKNRLKKRMD